MDDRRREEARELCEARAVLIAGSVRAERLWRRGSMVGLSSPVFKWMAALFWGLGTGKRQKNEGISSQGFL